MIKNWINKLTQGDSPAQAQSPEQHYEHQAKSHSSEKKSKKNHPSESSKASPKNQKEPHPKHHTKGNRPKKRSAKPKQPAWDISQFQVEAVEGKTRFHDLDLCDELMHAVQDLGFEYCSPIQAQVLPHTLKGTDAIGKAQTGTGKTAAFLIGIIDDLIKNPIAADERYLSEPRALIIAPTRELVMQIMEDAKGLCKHTDLHIVNLVGGLDYAKQQQQMDQKFIDIVVATPGRLIDFMQRKHIYLDQVEAMVLDEADRMLDMGFIPQVKRIVRATPRPEDRQTLLFSATFTQDILNLATQWTYKPVTVEIEPEHVATDTVEQRVFMLEKEQKFNVLVNLLKKEEVKKTIIFANRRDQTQRLYDRLRKAGIHIGILSGEINQQKRTRTLEQFKSGKLDALVATDVVGRGIHIDGITHVINYHLPDDPEDYVHRIGRTGRAGASGTAISLACEFEAFQLPTIEELLGNKLTCEYPDEALLKSH